MLEHLFKMTVVDFVGTIINIAYVIQFELAEGRSPPWPVPRSLASSSRSHVRMLADSGP
jgi:hypothetical protein